MHVVTVKAIAKELHERGHYLDELYQITIAYATSLHTRYCAVEAKCEAIEQYYRDEVDLDKYSWEEDDKWLQLDEERSDIEDEMQDLFNTVIGFDYEIDPFKK
jgi:hypothetical protein